MIDDIFELMDFFPNSFVNNEKELILIPEQNLFFQLSDVEDRDDLVYKLLAWFSDIFSRSPKKLTNLNQFLGKNFTRKEMGLIYQKIGNGINKDLAYKFIKNNFDLEVLHGE